MTLVLVQGTPGRAGSGEHYPDGYPAQRLSCAPKLREKSRGARSGTPALVTAIDATPAGWDPRRLPPPRRH